MTEVFQLQVQINNVWMSLPVGSTNYTSMEMLCARVTERAARLKLTMPFRIVSTSEQTQALVAG
jgi:hypothetical protein